jgi:uncharacterized protein (DUF2235 family)
VVSQAYRDGDREIDIFGFSRGAAEARALANKIYREGLVEPWSKEKLADGGSVAIRFMGLFDTVDARGLGYNITTYAAGDQGIPPTVQAVRHATAQGEFRQTFGLVRLAADSCSSDSRLVERGFPGAHSDVGGGYGNGMLSKLPLEWVWQEARRSGVPLGQLLPTDRPSAGLRRLAGGPGAAGLAHDSMGISDPLGALLDSAFGVRVGRPTYSPIGCPVRP